jgi:hypothetical protein
MRDLFRAIVGIGLVAVLSACGGESQCACIGTRFAVDYVGTLTQVASPSDTSSGHVRMVDSLNQAAYTDDRLTARFDLYENRVFVSFHNRTADTLTLSVAGTRFIDSTGRWPVEVYDYTDPSPAYDSSGHDGSIASLSIPAGDTVSTELVPQIAQKNDRMPLFFPARLPFFGHNHLGSIPENKMRSTAAEQLQEHFGNTYALLLPIDGPDAEHRYTFSFEVQEINVYGPSNVASLTKPHDDSLVISRMRRDS